jgi:adenosylcobinamide kinase / adenosylcobinamide-phosphate guanylyltransferase
MAHRQLIFITGGVRSGKSRIAEKVATELAHELNGKLVYIACGQPSDAEMRKRIQRHQMDREQNSHPWKTIECAQNVGVVSKELQQEHVVLLDCLTTLLNNEFFSEADKWKQDISLIKHSIQSGLMKIQENCHTVIIVSNEVLYEPLASNELVFTYGKILGELHQWIVSRADQAYLVEAGMPLLMKGEGSR